MTYSSVFIFWLKILVFTHFFLLLSWPITHFTGEEKGVLSCSSAFRFKCKMYQMNGVFLIIFLTLFSSLLYSTVFFAGCHSILKPWKILHYILKVRGVVKDGLLWYMWSRSGRIWRYMVFPELYFNKKKGPPWLILVLSKQFLQLYKYSVSLHSWCEYGN